MLVYGKYECFVMQMFVSCVYTAFCMTFILLMLVEDARGNHMEYPYCRACLMTVL